MPADRPSAICKLKLVYSHRNAYHANSSAFPLLLAEPKKNSFVSLSLSRTHGRVPTLRKAFTFPPPLIEGWHFLDGQPDSAVNATDHTQHTHARAHKRERERDWKKKSKPTSVNLWAMMASVSLGEYSCPGCGKARDAAATGVSPSSSSMLCAAPRQGWTVGGCVDAQGTRHNKTADKNEEGVGGRRKTDTNKHG